MSCEQIAVLGLTPKWACGGGYAWVWELPEWARESSYDTHFVREESSGDFEYSRIQWPELLKNVLTLSDLMAR